MKRIRYIFCLSCLLAIKIVQAQDPAFSQFFSSPLNVNPALTANIHADWRFIANFRDQWIGPAAPYMTATASYDRKIMQNKMPGVFKEQSEIGVGGMMMFDYAMSGVVKSIYLSGNFSYSALLSEGEKTTHRLTAGFGTTFSDRNVDFSRVDFEEQFTGFGFNKNLPTGEAALSNMKGHLSVNTGLVYSVYSERNNFDLGGAMYHVNQPRQTFLEDEHQRLPIRYVAHSNFERVLNDQLVLNVNAIYQFQKEAKYYSFGAALGHYIGYRQDMMVNAGLWYWSRNAIIPYVGLTYGNYQVGFSYDYTVSKLNQATDKPNTFEISFIIRGIKEPVPSIPCPWK